MNRPLHLARKDARRLAGGLGAWLVLFPLPAALLVLHAAGRLNSFGPDAPTLLGGLHGVLCVAGFLLAVQLALEDPLHDANAGWRTRPITARDLLLAKLGLAGAALVIAPVALLIIVWAAAGFTPRDIAILSFEQTATHVLIAGFGLLLGSLTRHLGQALLWLAGLLPGLVLAAALWSEHHTDTTAVTLVAVAFPTLALALSAAYRPRVSRLLAGGLGIAAAVLMTLGVFSSLPAGYTFIPDTELVRGDAPRPLAAGSAAGIGSDHLRLARLTPDFDDATPPEPVLRLEWRRLAPHCSLISRIPTTTPPPPILIGPDRLELTPRSASARYTHLAGMRFTRHELLLPGARQAGTTWLPSANILR